MAQFLSIQRKILWNEFNIEKRIMKFLDKKIRINF